MILSKHPLVADFTKQKTLGMVRNEGLVKKLAKNLNRVKFWAGFSFHSFDAHMSDSNLKPA